MRLVLPLCTLQSASGELSTVPTVLWKKEYTIVAIDPATIIAVLCFSSLLILPDPMSMVGTCGTKLVPK